MDRSIPVITQFSFTVLRRGLNISSLVGLAVNSCDTTTLIFRVDVVGIGRIYKHPKAVASIHVLPATVCDTSRILGVANPGTVILQATVNVIGHVHVHADMIKLRDGQVLGLPPSVASIIRIPKATIITSNHMIGVIGINPHVVEVSMCAPGDVAKTLATIVTDN